MATIDKVAKQFELSVPTLHYYERAGLLPTIGRNAAGHRDYCEKDIEWIRLIQCFRRSGMSISEIKKYVELCHSEEDTVDQRYEVLLAQKNRVMEQIEVYQSNLQVIQRKIDHYAKKKEEKHDPLNPVKKK